MLEVVGWYIKYVGLQPLKHKACKGKCVILEEQFVQGKICKAL